MAKRCLITGVGPGTGTSLVKRFVEGGYDVAMLARSEDRLEELAAESSSAHAYPCDLSDEVSLKSTLAKIELEFGSPSVVIHNAVGGAFGNYLDLDPDVLQRNFQINTMALLHLAQATLPKMIEAGEGVLICTGNTSSQRGRAAFAGFAPTKAAQRILCEAIARDSGPKGVHVAYVMIDAMIDVAWTRHLNPDAPDDVFCKPDDIASECFHVAHQPRSAWSFNVEIRPHREIW